ncbi:MAG: HD domain-containing protein [Candidatus Didemnitutus sp.]|nr:HD domain-containing protein [Candidatus Didemnitutus sp.]
MASDLDLLEQRCRERLEAAASDAAHDAEHVRRVVHNARRLAAAENARMEIVLPAAWLHDCVSVAKDSPERPRASRLAAVQANGWLRQWGWAEEWLADISHAIEAHSFSAGIAPRTVEARVVQDADRLDALGAVGLARCLMLGGEMGRPLYVPEDPFAERRPPDDHRACLDHFFTKLLGLSATMQTDAGKIEAVRRTEFLHGYLRQLRREIGN